MTEINKTAVVTGISSGIGRAICQSLITDGWRVFGSVRKQSDAKEAGKFLGASFTPLIFDVTDSDAINRAAASVEKDIGCAALGALINNAGVAVAGPVRYLPIEDIQRQLDINLYGPLRVIQAFLPMLGADRKFTGPPGKIINMSSVAGKIASPFMSPYAMSKHALEAMSDSLRRELLPHGIDVVIVGPGAVKTPIWAKADDMDIEQYAETEYHDVLIRMKEEMQTVGEQGLPPEEIGRLVRDILNNDRPKTRYAVLKDKLMNWNAPMLAPARMVDRAIAKRFGIRVHDND